MTLSVIDEYKPLFDAPVKQWQNGLVDSARSTRPSVPGSIPSDGNRSLFFLTSNFFLCSSFSIYLVVSSIFPFIYTIYIVIIFFSIEGLVMSSYISLCVLVGLYIE